MFDSGASAERKVDTLGVLPSASSQGQQQSKGVHIVDDYMPELLHEVISGHQLEHDPVLRRPAAIRLSGGTDYKKRRPSKVMIRKLTKSISTLRHRVIRLERLAGVKRKREDRERLDEEADEADAEEFVRSKVAMEYASRSPLYAPSSPQYSTAEHAPGEMDINGVVEDPYQEGPRYLSPAYAVWSYPGKKLKIGGPFPADYNSDQYAMEEEIEDESEDDE